VCFECEEQYQLTGNETMALTISKFTVNHLYKWILPIFTTLLLILFADKDRSLILLIFLWLLLLTAYLSIPINFVKPKKENFIFFTQRNILSLTVILIQAIVLSLVVSIVTWALTVMYLYELTNQNIAISITNGLLYFITLLLEYFVLPEKLEK
jgi:hypothetical protein